ncbi:PspC domain-containing protein [Telmatospirillum siberiense]|uniref:Phage shock protein PspC N-terminal domain-containing protein n=1 Tax=Telmatospirillum siberiense TaxID=382514 RepID=A0A2N3PYS8_9PROT|nr:PspC domain-containing protein [Telmatospirillum siberiense]PKU25572.1 hypothetical protein CWS72_05785 [Telmatospirillum siberiense]
MNFSFHWPERPSELRRDPAHGKIAGVCAGLGTYFEVSPKFIRVALVLGCVFGLFIPLVAGYVLLTMLLPTVAESESVDFPGTGGSPAWNTAASGDRIDALKDHFRHLDQRLAAIEAQVTSDEFRLRQKFRDL